MTAQEYKSESPVALVGYLGIDFHGWATEFYQTTSSGHADYCKARGRYEIAEAFYHMHVSYYEKNIVNCDDDYLNSLTSDEFKERVHSILTYIKAYASEFPLMVFDRESVLAQLCNSPSGLTRMELERCTLTLSETKFGVFLNQLERGGWIHRSGKGKTDLITYAEQQETNRQFLERNIPEGIQGMGTPLAP